jgi:hypothetical protein
MNEDMRGLIGCAVWIAVPVFLIVYGVGWGFTSLTNLIKYGKFTKDTRTAMVDAHLGDPAYFADLAAQAGIKLTSWSITTQDGTPQDGDNQGVSAMFTFTNNSDHSHEVIISLAQARVVLNGQVKVVSLDCNLGPGNDFKIPAGGSTQTGQCYRDIFSSVSGKAVLAAKPQIVAIDSLPVTGGPDNTPWRCLTDSAAGEYGFSNSC